MSEPFSSLSDSNLRISLPILVKFVIDIHQFALIKSNKSWCKDDAPCFSLPNWIVFSSDKWSNKIRIMLPFRQRSGNTVGIMLNLFTLICTRGLV